MANYFDLHAAAALATKPGPFVTMTLPITGVPATDRTQFNSLLKAGKRQLAEVAPNRNWAVYEESFAPYEHGPLTNGSARGLLIMAGATESYHYWLHTAVGPTITVTYQPNVLPILRSRDTISDYDLLLLDSQGFEVAQVRSGRPELVNLPVDAPNTLEKALGSELRDRGRWQRSAGDSTHYSGTGTLDASKSADQRNYFMAVDAYVSQQFSNVDQVPLILVASAKNQGNFRKLSQNAYLDANVRVVQAPNLAAANQTLVALMVGVNDQRHVQAAQIRQDAYDKVRQQKQVVQDLGALATAAVQGQIAKLWIQDDAFQAGHLTESGDVMTATALSRQNNLYNDLALVVSQRGGQVEVLPADAMPTRSPIAAQLRIRESVQL
ncbi:baeRF6 domain-containing protein [Levilactobacillus tujiorum]|uniref:Bacterial archaeo-eukaryotic release factor family 6 domain-containing protein n=1 Tax=Levilactobacillus tujiorum TaxID=2912243 RepID=A0ABX1L6P3_9LACO|nr:hypothetical protein [Levilactobacillus tujiorum]MCH5465704.1 hypothetical protein [Levilactobacillus tujiorum]NLR12883.1 hypothetical protein [Lactobacillus sp. HBUAS51387]NLR30735.1 hypothetical protein [Levilactobacillus tujiorum]